MKVTEIRTDGDFREEMHGVSVHFPCVIHTASFDQFRNGAVSWHWHNEAELAYVSQGTMDVLIPHSRLQLKTGDAIFLAPELLHSYQPAAKNTREDTCLFDPILVAGYRNSYFDRTFVSPVLQNESCKCMVFSHERTEHRTILHLIKSLVEIEAAASPGWQLEMSACLSRVWVQLFRLSGSERSTATAIHDRNDQRAKEMIAFLQRHYNEPLEMEQISAAANIGVREGYRVFRSTLGMSPIQYLTNYRIHKAAEQLTQTSTPVTEISENCGFSTPSYFARVFRGQMGCTPREYRTAFHKRSAI